MSGQARHELILELLHRDGHVEVSHLAETFATSEVTIRRDLDHLARVGVLRRVHGGAESALLRGEGMPFVMRELDAATIKAHMATAVSELLVDGEAVALDSGTSGEAVARALTSRRLTIMPFSLQAIAVLAGSGSVSLLLPGGSVRAEEGAIVGPLAEAALTSLRFDTAIISPCAASVADGLMAFDLQDAAIKRGMIAAARRVVLVAEGAKFSRSAMAIICPLERIDILVTDESAPIAVLDAVREAGGVVVTVPAITLP